MEAVERHMEPVMNAGRNNTMNWFFNEWVFGSEVPKYAFDYSLKEDEGGKWLLTGKLTQSNVSEKFIMPVPVYADFDGDLVRLGFIRMQGSSSNDGLKVRLPKKPRRVLVNGNYDVLASESSSKES